MNHLTQKNERENCSANRRASSVQENFLLSIAKRWLPVNQSNEWIDNGSARLNQIPQKIPKGNCVWINNYAHPTTKAEIGVSSPHVSD